VGDTIHAIAVITEVCCGASPIMPAGGSYPSHNHELLYLDQRTEIRKSSPNAGNPAPIFGALFRGVIASNFCVLLDPSPTAKSFDSLGRVERSIMATKLMPLRPSGGALRSLSRRRPSQHAFSTSPATATLSPHSKSSKKITSEPTKRTQATAAAPAPYDYLARLIKSASILTVPIQTNKTNTQSCF